MSPFGHANAPLASGPPFLAVAGPPLLLLALAGDALGRAIGDADAFDAAAVASFPALVDRDKPAPFSSRCLEPKPAAEAKSAEIAPRGQREAKDITYSDWESFA